MGRKCWHRFGRSEFSASSQDGQVVLDATCANAAFSKKTSLPDWPSRPSVYLSESAWWWTRNLSCPWSERRSISGWIKHKWDQSLPIMVPHLYSLVQRTNASAFEKSHVSVEEPVSCLRTIVTSTTESKGAGLTKQKLILKRQLCIVVYRVSWQMSVSVGGSPALLPRKLPQKKPALW